VNSPSEACHGVNLGFGLELVPLRSCWGETHSFVPRFTNRRFSPQSMTELPRPTGRFGKGEGESGEVAWTGIQLDQWMTLVSGPLASASPKREKKGAARNQPDRSEETDLRQQISTNKHANPSQRVFFKHRFLHVSSRRFCQQGTFHTLSLHAVHWYGV
jgi:hypothetical protein